jgi:hypothetical protein
MRIAIRAAREKRKDEIGSDGKEPDHGRREHSGIRDRPMGGPWNCNAGQKRSHPVKAQHLVKLPQLVIGGNMVLQRNR